MQIDFTNKHQITTVSCLSTPIFIHLCPLIILLSVLRVDGCSAIVYCFSHVIQLPSVAQATVRAWTIFCVRPCSFGFPPGSWAPHFLCLPSIVCCGPATVTCSITSQALCHMAANIMLPVHMPSIGLSGSHAERKHEHKTATVRNVKRDV